MHYILPLLYTRGLSRVSSSMLFQLIFKLISNVFFLSAVFYMIETCISCTAIFLIFFFFVLFFCWFYYSLFYNVTSSASESNRNIPFFFFRSLHIIIINTCLGPLNFGKLLIIVFCGQMTASTSWQTGFEKIIKQLVVKCFLCGCEVGHKLSWAVCYAATLAIKVHLHLQISFWYSVTQKQVSIGV